MRSMLIRQGRLWVKTRFVHWAVILLLAGIMLSACASQASSTAENTLSPTIANEPDNTPSPVITQIPGGTTPKVTPVKTKITPDATCAEKRGSITRSYIISKELPGRLYYSLYLPPCYSDNSKYPVLYLLHGLSYQDDQWIRLGLPGIMDMNITGGYFPSFIVVMPYDPGWEDPNVGKYDRAISEDLVPWIDSQYSIKKDRTYHAIGGLSRGSAWAFHIGVRYNKIFSIIGIHSPAFFRSDRKKMDTILSEVATSPYPIRILLDAGTLDPELNYATRFEGYLTKYSIEHTWDNPSGTHSEAYWRENLEYYLQEYSRDW